RTLGRQRLPRIPVRGRHHTCVRCSDQGDPRNINGAAMHGATRRTRRGRDLRSLDQLTLYSGSQMPHIVRNGLLDCLGIEQGRIRIVSPDIGGGFGHKGILLPEEVCLSWLAMQKSLTVRWIEDRREHLSASANCREHYYNITVYADRDGALRGID